MTFGPSNSERFVVDVPFPSLPHSYPVPEIATVRPRLGWSVVVLRCVPISVGCLGTIDLVPDTHDPRLTFVASTGGHHHAM